MSKAILVMNMPENCYKCILNNGNFCSPTNNCVLKYFNCKPNWCPLKNMPEKYDKASCDDSNYYHMSTGWNNCIDEILGKN